MNDAIDVLKDVQQVAGTRQSREVGLKQLNEAHDHLQARLSDLDPDRARPLAALASAVGKADPGRAPAALDELAKSLAALRADLPPGFCPPQKLAQAIDAARRAHPGGIAIFAAGSVTREKLWPALEKALGR